MLRKISVISLIVFFVANFGCVSSTSASSNNSGMIRVNLVSMGRPQSVSFEVQGNYSVVENPELIIERKAYQVTIENSQLTLSDGITRHVMGSSFTLRQHNGADPNHLRVRNASYGLVNYQGDMRFSVANGAIVMVNHIYIENYLYGVVPAEMPNSWHIEALKAQAVAARTFALRSQNANRSNPTADLCDTQMSQVYRGFNHLLTNSINAVDQTAGLVLLHGGALAATFYSSSNGGMTEAASNVWGGTGNLLYSIIIADPFDARNVLNPNAFWTFEIPKINLPTAVNNSLAAEISPLLISLGYSSVLSDIQVREVRDVTLSPANASGRVGSARVTLLLDLIRLSDRGRETIARTFSFERSGIRRALGLRSLLFTMNDAGDRFVFTGRGFGHGVGMSQFGAQQKAVENHTFDQILAFYYPGTTLLDAALVRPQLTDMPSRGGNRDPLPEQPQPEQPLPEQPQSEQPQTEQPTQEQPKQEEPAVVQPVPELQRSSAVVTASRLNVREQKSTSGNRLGTLNRGTSITVIGDRADWVYIEHGNLKGYVLATHLRFTDVAGATQAASTAIGTATVTASRINVRSGPGTNHARVGSVSRNAKVEILEKSGTWYRIRTSAVTGFVDGRFLKVSNSTRNEAANLRNATVTASVLNIRSGPGTTNSVVGRLNRGMLVEVSDSVNGWHKVTVGNVKGYVLSAHLRLAS